MPELPDIAIYLEALEHRILGQTLNQIRIASPFLLRTVNPPYQSLCGHKVTALRRLGKRIALGFENDLWLVLHLMIAGRLHWFASAPADVPPGSAVRMPPRGLRSRKLSGQQAVFEFDSAVLVLTEAGSKRRASLHIVEGDAGLRSLDRGGLEVLDCPLSEFADAIQRENHTLKRCLTHPRLFSGIGNAYSDEILHRAGLSPVALTRKLSPREIERLFLATKETLGEWIARLRAERGDCFPEKVTAFRAAMAVHGKYGLPCPVCGTKVQRIRYADNETDYCPRCQTNGKLLADRSLSLLLKRDWPKTPEELEEMRTASRPRHLRPPGAGR